MYQAVTPRATVGPIGPPAPGARRVAPAPQRGRRGHGRIGALASMTLVLVGLLITHVLAHGTVGHWDEASTRWLATHRDSGLDALTKVLSRSADTMGIIAAAVVVAIVVGLRRRWDHLAILVTGLVLELSVFISVNVIVGRPRPSVERLGATPTTGSFPSGHTAATLVLYATIALIVSETARSFVWLALTRLAAVLMPIAVGFARVYRGFHHPTDVFFGVLLGCAALIIAIRRRTPVGAGPGPGGSSMTAVKTEQHRTERTGLTPSRSQPRSPSSPTAARRSVAGCWNCAASSATPESPTRHGSRCRRARRRPSRPAPP